MDTMDSPSLSCDHSPIRKLSAEILSQIFLDSINKTNNRLPNILTTCAPLKLRHICQSWRKLALGTPLLWATIIAPVIADYSKEEIYSNLDEYLCAIEEFLMRSENCPLTISIVFRHNGEIMEPVPVEIETIITKLWLHSHRWKDISLELPRRPMRLVYSGISSGVPDLKSLALSHFPPLFIGWLDLSDAHHLEYLHIQYPAQIAPGGPIMHKMREIRVDNHTVSAVLDWAENCPSLEHIVFCSDSNSNLLPIDTRPSGIRIHVLPSLVQCHFIVPDNVQTVLLLDRLQLPALKFFSLVTTSGVANLDYSGLVRFMQCSRPALTALNLVVQGLSTAELHDCLRCVPSLIALRVHIHHFSEDSILPFLARSPTHVESVLCPNLQSLWVLDDDDAASQAVAKLVVQRWKTAFVTSMKRISILSISEMNMEAFMICPGVQRCVEEGLVFNSKVFWTENAHQIVAVSDQVASHSSDQIWGFPGE